MTNGEFMELLIKDLKAYHASGPMDSVRRNIHMSDYRGQPAPPDAVDALLVDFVNFVGGRRGMDLGLYTRDLREGGRGRTPMTILTAPDYLIEWSNGFLGGFIDPGIAMISIAENRQIDLEAVKIWQRADEGFQLYYKQITKDDLERIAFPERFEQSHLANPAASFAPVGA